MPFPSLYFHHIVNVGNGFGYAYVQNDNNLKYEVVRVKFGTDGKPSLDRYVGEAHKEERDAKARVGWWLADEMSWERKGQPLFPE